MHPLDRVGRTADIVPNVGRRSFFEPGQNCWRVETANRVAFLVDGDAYFHAFREAAIRARHSIMILGWDFDTRVRMLIDRDPDGFPDQLGQFLSALLVKQKQLHIYVLTWDFHLIYFRERQWWLPSHLSAQRRLHFVKDGNHPVGASHHQKVVVIDDAVAFAGGLDFAQCRWDTRDHRADHPARLIPTEDRPCRPFHDVQIAVDGAAAKALGRLARDRWQEATGRTIPDKRPKPGHDPWPPSVAPSVQHVNIAIARTMPEWEHHDEVREVERLLVDLLKAARRCIYIETQYFTSRVLAAVLIERLQEPEGPDVVMILHPNSDGWLEQHTMDVLRGRVLKRLRAADRFARLGLYYPHLPDLKGSQCISMHSKVCVIDQDYVRIGSANFSNRSMGFDSECDLAFCAEGDPDVQARIASFRNDLLAEHLDTTRDDVRRAIDSHPSMIAAIESLRREGRSLEVFDGHIPPEVDDLVPDADFVDPSRPYEANLVPEEHRPTVRRQIAMGAFILLAVVGLAAAWRWSPLAEWLDVPRLLSYAEEFERSPSAPFVTIAGFLVGGLLVAPITVLITVTVLAFGPLHGFVYSFIGMTLSALLTFFIGRLLGRQAIERWSDRVHRLSRRLGEKGILAVVTVRVLPVAPFSIVNIIAGATHIRARDFFIGTMIGELPGLIALSIFVDQITSTVKHPGPGSYALLAGSAALIVGGVWFLRRWLSRHVDHRAVRNSSG
ncbi:MAG TPA: VTT domain-containing protein [Nitrospiraceae bacterium]|nr:VTT domain-containing protein [Nitrospiraceae bacterium]